MRISDWSSDVCSSDLGACACRRSPMEHQKKSTAVSRRAVLQLAAATGLAQLAPPFIISARGEQSVKLGLDNPLTGTYAATGKNELNGCELAVEQINAKGDRQSVGSGKSV